MSLIDSTYFVGDISIPNIDKFPNTFQDEYIDKYEKEILTKLLGYQLYNEFITGLEAGTPDQKWIDLRDGADFTFDYYGQTVTTKWEGLINTDLISIISYYVYCKYVKENVTDSTGIGEVKGLPENSVSVMSVQKFSSACNKMVDLYGYVCGYEYYFNKYDTTYQVYTDQPSAYNFLNANRVNYDNWLFTPIKKVNALNI